MLGPVYLLYICIYGMTIWLNSSILCREQWMRYNRKYRKRSSLSWFMSRRAQWLSWTSIHPSLIHCLFHSPSLPLTDTVAVGVLREAREAVLLLRAAAEWAVCVLALESQATVMGLQSTLINIWEGRRAQVLVQPRGLQVRKPHCQVWSLKSTDLSRHWH